MVASFALVMALAASTAGALPHHHHHATAAARDHARVAAAIAQAVAEVEASPSRRALQLLNAATNPPTMASHYAGSVSPLTQASSLNALHSYEIYSDDAQLRVILTNEVLPFMDNKYAINTSTILTANASYLTIADRCQPLPAQDHFSSIYSWLKYAKDGGNTTVTGRPCSLYTFTVPTEGLSLALCVDAKTGRLPLLYNISIPGYNSSSVYGLDIHETLLPNETALLGVPPRCLQPPVICDNGKVQEFDAYIFHPANQFDLVNEDVADLLGDTAFICCDALSGHTSSDGYQWVSRYSLQVWGGWGDYAECNRPTPHAEGECISFETYAVGREASFALKPHAGQCVDNSDVGTWLSLPAAGKCQNASQTLGPRGGGNCSWRVVEKLKTINGTCLLQDRGMLQSCKGETDFPFPKTTPILANAFKYTDPAQGGCPDISP